MGFFEKLKQGLTKTKDSIVKQVDNLFKAFVKVDEDFLEELEELLILADLGAGVAMEIIDKLRDRIKDEKLEDSEQVKAALKEIRSADMIIVAGTSLVVYPAAGFLHYFGGDCLALVNKSETSIGASANFVSRQPIGAMMDW